MNGDGASHDLTNPDYVTTPEATGRTVRLSHRRSVVLRFARASVLHSTRRGAKHALKVRSASALIFSTEGISLPNSSNDSKGETRDRRASHMGGDSVPLCVGASRRLDTGLRNLIRGNGKTPA